MKLLKRSIENNAEGTVVLIPEESEDLWHIFNLVSIGDLVKAVTYRKVEKASATGTVSKERKKMVMTLKVTKVPEYDPDGDEIRFGDRGVVLCNYIPCLFGAFSSIFHRRKGGEGGKKDFKF
jgi:Predicted RNA-binding proteins